MNTIPSVFTKRGFNHRELVRNGEWRLFERTGRGKSHYEVVRIRSHNGYIIHDVIIPSSEYYPKSESWGTDGFTLNSLESARHKLAAVAERTDPLA